MQIEASKWGYIWGTIEDSYGLEGIMKEASEFYMIIKEISRIKAHKYRF